ncbi:GRIM-19 protein-domain-containing protein [Geopyxis carbonaria]|nr:GRIM-19 protein-domain-containing protein [Geopyxis carbonaria]
MVQDLPPTGGYGPIQYRRNVPFRGFRPSYYIYGMGAICAFGFYVAIGGIKERREMAREKIWTRIHLTPMLQAEADRDDVRRAWANEARERELMKDVKGWEGGSVYHSNRFIRPTYTVTPPKESIIREKDLARIAAENEGTNTAA